MADLIKCRSKVSEHCYDGKPVGEIYGEDVPISEDGTWDGESVVCDACYLDLGAPGINVNSPEARSYGSRLEGGKGPPR
jgi:hypothetical protein